MSAVLIIYTGGTIGMQPSSDGFSPAGNFDALIEKHMSTSEQHTLAPYQLLEFEHLIDSSNSQPHHWREIAQCILDNYDHYCGFVILHGTDTMAYTAAALDHMLAGCAKNIVVTGSQIPMAQPRSDGPANLLGAVLAARSKPLYQASLYFDNKLMRARSASKVHSSAFAAFDSPNAPLLAHSGIDICQLTHPEPRAANFNCELEPAGSVDVLLLYPGISDSAICGVLDNPNLKAAVLLSFGAGNLADHNTVLMEKIAQARARGVVIINKTQCHQGAVAQGNYAVSSQLGKLGVISAEQRTLEDVVTDLYVNLANYQKQD
ncbi:MAG: asparaginase [Pseudomonadales bacterium]